MSGSIAAQDRPVILLETARSRLRRLVAADLDRLVESDCVYAEDILAGRAEAARVAVKYPITRPLWLARQA